MGIAEADAFAEGRKIRVTKVPFSASARALIDNDPRGFVKIISDPATGIVLGGSIVGTRRLRAHFGARGGSDRPAAGLGHRRVDARPSHARRGLGGGRRMTDLTRCDEDQRPIPDRRFGELYEIHKVGSRCLYVHSVNWTMTTCDRHGIWR